MINEDNYLSKSAETAWRNLDDKMNAQIEEESKKIMTSTRTELKETIALVERNLAEQEPDLQEAIEKVMSKVENFNDGVNLWREKAETSIKLIEEKQRALANMLQTIINESEQEREKLASTQRQRATEIEKECERIHTQMELENSMEKSKYEKVNNSK